MEKTILGPSAPAPAQPDLHIQRPPEAVARGARRERWQAERGRNVEERQRQAEWQREGGPYEDTGGKEQRQTAAETQEGQMGSQTPSTVQEPWAHKAKSGVGEQAPREEGEESERAPNAPCRCRPHLKPSPRPHSRASGWAAPSRRQMRLRRS